MNEFLDQKPFRYCVMGGTFDRLHEGHKLLLRTASLLAENVFVGIVSNDFLERVKKNKKYFELIQDFNTRFENVEKYVKGLSSNFVLDKLDDAFGPAVTEPKADVIVVSCETLTTAKRINNIRENKGLMPLQICVVPFVKTDDGIIISSSYLRSLEKERQ